MLSEEKIDNRDLKQLKQVLSFTKVSTKKGSFILKSYSDLYDEKEREFDYVQGKGNIILEYNADFFDLTNSLIDMLDGISDVSFKSTEDKQTNTIIFKIKRK